MNTACEEPADGEVRILVTSTGKQITHFLSLLRRALPMLGDPSSVSENERAALTTEIACALEEMPEEDYEPGCLVEEEPW